MADAVMCAHFKNRQCRFSGGCAEVCARVPEDKKAAARVVARVKRINRASKKPSA